MVAYLLRWQINYILKYILQFSLKKLWKNVMYIYKVRL